MRSILPLSFALLLLIAPALHAAEVPDLRTRKDGSDWSAFLGPTGDSKSTEKGILTKWPDEGPRILWQMKIAEGYAMPSISRGRLFLFDRTKIEAPKVIANDRGFDDVNRLRCLKSETGDELWSFTYPTDFEDLLGYSGGPRCCPVIDDDRVYILGAEGVLHCLDVVKGAVKWKLDTVKEFGVVKNFFGVGATPVIEGDLLITQVGGSPPNQGRDVYDAGGKIEPNGTGIVALNKHTGKVEYKITRELASYATPTLATIGDRRWCFTLCRGGLVAFEPKTGKVDFQLPWRSGMLNSVNASSPVVVDDHVLISECYEIGGALLKLKPGAESGHEIVWSDKDKRDRLRSMKAHWNTPIHIDGYLYGCSGRNEPDSDLRCVELKTGKVMWTTMSVPYRVPDSKPDAQPLNLRLARTSLLYADGHFIAMSEWGIIVLLKVDPEKFDPVAVTLLQKENFEEPEPLLKDPCWAAPILSHGMLYLRGRHELVCLELIPKK
ncbi:MAG: PQQ-binding-like beta-propeller repeat protein [Phycisphaeraceae bacterium]